jgi:nucleoside-diphosphate-sugar epimerase
MYSCQDPDWLVPQRSSSPRHVLVTGAAGLVGRATLRLLAADGIAATALVLDDPGDLPATRIVVGDATRPDDVAAALAGVDAVIHLAALPSPAAGPAETVYSTNARATFVVLEQAGRAGVRHAALASSYAIAGRTFGVRPAPLPYLPLDAAIPLRISDPYALSKQADEATAAMMARRHGMTVVALRLPFVGGPDDRLASAAARYAERPETGATEVWSYVDKRDAARAMLAANRVERVGAHVLYVAAPVTLAPYPTEWLLNRYLPDVPRLRVFPGRTVPIDLKPARDLLGFVAEHVWPVAASTVR